MPHVPFGQLERSKDMNSDVRYILDALYDEDSRRVDRVLDMLPDWQGEEAYDFNNEFKKFLQSIPDALK